MDIYQVKCVRVSFDESGDKWLDEIVVIAGAPNIYADSSSKALEIAKESICALEYESEHRDFYAEDTGGNIKVYLVDVFGDDVLIRKYYNFQIFKRDRSGEFIPVDL